MLAVAANMLFQRNGDYVNLLCDYNVKWNLRISCTRQFSNNRTRSVGDFGDVMVMSTPRLPLG